MALLQRTRVLPNERLDLNDYQRIEDFVCADFKAIHQNVLANQNYVFSGFIPSGIGTNTLSLPVAGGSFVAGANDGALFIGAPSLSPITTTALSPGTTNYIELSVDQDTGGADSRAFWDSTGNGGQGSEFSQIIDTFTFLKAELKISTSNFSGDADKVRICEVDVNGSGVITAIRDRRDLFFRLGRGTNVAFTFPWSSRTEPANTSFTGADKDIKTQKQLNDAILDSLREIKGTTYWYELAPVSLQGSFRVTGLSILAAASSGAKFAWDGSKLSITDASVSPSVNDVVGYIRLFDVGTNVGMKRMDSANAISIADGQVLWVELPAPLADLSYSGVGLTSNNYRVSSRGSVPLKDTTYWLAYREGSNLYLRGLGELKAGETKEIEDETPEALAKYLGFDPETATSVPYSITPDSSLLQHTYTTASSLVDSISANAGNINDLAAILNKNPYEERMDVVAGIPANDKQIQGPVNAGDFITLPLDSRAGNVTARYIVGRGSLQLWYNGQYLTLGDDWAEVGSPGSLSSVIQILRPLQIKDRLVFRNALAAGVIFLGGGGGGGVSTMQDAYDNGNSITTQAGRPFLVGGSSAKVAQFNGDIGVTGVIDPKGITFLPQSSNPLDNTETGLWVDAAGDLVHSRPGVPDINITTLVSGGGSSVSNLVPMANHTGSSISKLTPVAVSITGDIDLVDPSQEAQALACVGVVADTAISDGQVGDIITAGRLPDITTTASFRDVMFVAKDGSLTNVKPSVGVGGFVSGDWVIRIGVIAKNLQNPMQKDLIVSPMVVGQL